MAASAASGDRRPGPKHEVGRYSNPAGLGSERQAQRRLKPDEIEDLLAVYLAGDLVRDIATRFDVSRTTVIGRVTRRGLPHRRDDDWTPTELAAAASACAAGHSLAEVGRQFGVDKSTVAHRFRRAVCR